MGNDVKYYLIRNSLLGKKDAGEYYLFKNWRWEKDEGNVILDHLYGYDAGEPSGSPYRFDNLSIMDEMVEISVEEAAIRRETMSIKKH